MVRGAIITCWAVLVATLAAPLTTGAQTVAEDIRREATAPNSETHHPLPLVGTWRSSSEWRYSEPNGFSPDWQLQMIMQGHHFLLGADIPLPEHCVATPCSDVTLGYWRTALQNASALQLPISLVGTQWEHYLLGGSCVSEPPVCAESERSNEWNRSAKTFAFWATQVLV